jgi:hypothetical protein
VQGKEPSYIDDGNVNQHNHYGEKVWRLFKKLKTENCHMIQQYHS